jgi:uncharacterized ferritin-like protein (DUF455 family)
MAATKQIKGVTLRADPARDTAFDVVQSPRDMHEYVGMSDIAQRQRIHRHMHNEMQALEIAAQTLSDFPDAPWELQLELARQCWDEVRHTIMMYRLVLERGGYKGEFPVMNHEWSIACMATTLIGRLTLQNRTFEGGEMDLLRHLSRMWREAGDEYTAGILDGFLADEVQHVRFANTWIKKLTANNPLAPLQVAEAVSFLRRVTSSLAPTPGETNGVGVDITAFTHMDGSEFVAFEDRRLAGFSEDELRVLAKPLTRSPENPENIDKATTS